MYQANNERLKPLVTESLSACSRNMEGTLERALGMLLRDEGNKDRVWETPG